MVARQGTASANPFTTHDYTFNLTAPAQPGTLFLYPECHFGAVNGWNPVAADDADQGLTHPWLAIVVTNGAPLDISPAVLPDAPGGALYDVALTGTGEGDGPWTFGVTDGGRLPAGLTLAADGRLSGVPVEAGVFTFAARAEDRCAPQAPATTCSSGAQAKRAYALAVSLPAACPAVGKAGALTEIKANAFQDVRLDFAPAAGSDASTVSRVDEKAEIPRPRRARAVTSAGCAATTAASCLDVGVVAGTAGTVFFYDVVGLCGGVEAAE